MSIPGTTSSMYRPEADGPCDRGYRARQQMRTLDENPYDPDDAPQQHREWKRGFARAERELYKASLAPRKADQQEGTAA